MVSYNITIVINDKRHYEWLSWLSEEYLPEVMMSLKFKNYKVWKLENLNEEEGITYSIQLFAENFDKINQYIEEFSSDLEATQREKFGNDYVSFRSTMKLVHKG